MAGSLYAPLAREPLWLRITVRILMGVAAWPLIVAGFGALSLPMTPGVVWAYAILTLGGALLILWRGRGRQQPTERDGHAWAMLGVMAATLALRCWQVRGVVWPLWGDAVNHSAAVALFLEQQGLPHNWGAYIPTSTTFSYHFGFHAWAAAVSWITSVPPWWAVFWTERFLSTLAPLGAYLLAVTFFRDRRIGLGAAIATGLLTMMPQYYVNFSRDTQLLGQTLVPLVAYLLAGAVRRSGWSVAAALAALSFTAMVFAHYLVYQLALGLVLAAVVLVAERRRWFGSLIRLGGVAVVGAALAAPWVWRVLQTQQAVWRSAHVQYSPDFGRLFFEAPPILEYETLPLLLAAALGLVVGLRRHPRPTLALLVWLGSMLLWANGYRTPIRALHQVNYIAVYMALYLITGPLVGVLLTYLADVIGPRLRLSRAALAGAAVIAGTVTGFAAYGNLVDETYVLVHAEDVRAFDWIKQNTPGDARFLINAFSATGEDGLVVGSDAGWWLTIATGRDVSVPVINYQTELVSPEYVARLQTLASYDTATLATEAGAAELCREGITHVYVGAVGGPLDGAALAQSPRYRPVYGDGAAMVLAIDCAP